MEGRLRGTITLFCALACALALFGSASSAFAQATSFQVEHFEPLPTQRTNLLNVARSQVIPHLEPSVGLFLHYSDQPLRVMERGSGEIESDLVASQTKAEFLFAIGLFDVAEIGLALPTVLYQSGDDLSLLGEPGRSINSVALADVRLVPKLAIPLPDAVDNFGIALLVPMYLPVGDDQSFNSDGSFRAEPRLALDFQHKGFAVATNLGYLFRPERVAQNHVVDDVLRWGVAAEMPIGVDQVGAVAKNPKLITSLFGNVQLSEDVSPSNPALTLDQGSASPLELQTAIRASFPFNLGVIVGGGVGLNEHVGSPAWRVFTSVGYVSTEGDSDGDGITDLEDACVDDPEDADGYRDSDGCPEVDNDGDGIADKDDQCPNDAEDIDNFQDVDGCPDADNDDDGIADNDDKCPNDPEDVDEFQDDDGCPEPDNDNDGFADADDECPLEPGIAEKQGCPDGDPDGDGIVGKKDKCPNNAEDFDSFQDEDGCPEADNDGDGLVDKDDQCPDDPETINKIDDEDGCPDRETVRVTKKKLEINEKVYFDTGKATIKTRSYALLNEVASLLAENSHIKQVRIEGHTDSRGSASFNQELSQKRAESVREYLIAQGIDASVVQATGMGESTPIASNANEEGRAKNRRVEFQIIERSDDL